MSDLIHITVVGRLTRDAELREAGSSQVCKFGLAATPYKKEAHFFDVDVWGNRGAAIVDFLTKGKQVVVVGELSKREYEARSGETRTSLDIRAAEVVLVGSKGDAAPATDTRDDEEDIGF